MFVEGVIFESQFSFLICPTVHVYLLIPLMSVYFLLFIFIDTTVFSCLLGKHCHSLDSSVFFLAVMDPTDSSVFKIIIQFYSRKSNPLNAI